MTSAGYEVFFYNHSGERVFLLTGWKYLEFSQRLSSPWNHQLRVDFGSDQDKRLLFIRNTLERDFIMEVYRLDEVTGIRSKVYEGFHITTVDQVNMQGVIQITLYGVGFTDLLTRRIVLPTTGQENNSKTGNAETIMKEFVDECAINPDDADRIIPGLSNDSDSGSTGTAAYDARYTNLLTVVTRCAEQGGLDFGITGGDEVATFVFRAAELWDADRRQGNTEGNVPVIFDLMLNNMEIPIFSKSGGDVKNFVYIGGSGVGVDRSIRELSDADDVAVSPFNRREAFVDARSQKSDDSMDTAGAAYLDENGYKEKFTFNLKQTSGTRWLRDWVLGSLITARYFNRDFDKKIVEVSVTISAGETGEAIEEYITAEMQNV